jgi:transposase-like protein
MAVKSTARERAELIVKVRSGQMTAAAAAAALGVSRKTYYHWESRGLSGMLGQLEDKEPGRPPAGPSPALVRMQSELARLKKRAQSLEQTLKIRGLLRRMEQSAAKKKRPTPSGS